jgi:superfamily II DNA or RNA helicase
MSLPVAANDIITSDQLPEPARVIQVFPEGEKLHIMAVGVETNQFYDRTFHPNEVHVRRITFAADGERFRLAALAERIRAAAQYDPQFAVGVSQIDPLPHQLDAVYNYLLKVPRIRFLLADDPGAGKTIMAGLLVKELQNRGVLERVLVIAPANLTKQWQDEMRDRFGLDFSVIRREHISATPGSDLWLRNPRAVMSVDFAKREEVKATFEGVRWDLVIVDEAHKMAAYQYSDRVGKTQAYQLGEMLSRNHTDHLLLMTATPHRGNPDNFRLLLSLLDPDMFQSNDDLAGLLRQRQMPIFLRRLKEHMVDFENKPLFPPRDVQTIRYELTGVERDLYNAVTDYVSLRFQRAEQIHDDQVRRNVGLALSVLQRRLASSLRAIRISLQRREEKLRNQRGLLQSMAVQPIVQSFIFDDEDLDDEERWNQEDEALGVTSAVRSVQEMDLEIQEVHNLVELALRAEAEAETQDSERKLNQLRDVLTDPLGNSQSLWDTSEKLLVFTENRDTLNYLRERFQAWGFRVAEIYGGMDQKQREAAQKYFKDPKGAQIMVATEAAGEGINLQFCRLMVNYDIPWNPNRLEQRMGRIHRYGQKFSVRIFNLVANDTREGDVLDSVLDKLEQMRTDLGVENVYDIIGDLLTSTDLANLVQQAIKDSQSLDQIREAVATTVDANEQRRKMQAALVESLVSDMLSPDALAQIHDQVRTANEQRLVPEYVERFVVSAFRLLARDNNLRADIRLRANDPGVWQIENVPSFIRSAAPAGYSIPPTYPQIIFTKAMREDYPNAAFVVPGHPLFDALLLLVRDKYGKFLTEGACFAAPVLDQGLFWLVESSVKDGTGKIAHQRLIGIQQASDGTLTQRDPLSLLDVEPIAEHGADAALVPAAARALAGTPQKVEAWTKETIVQWDYEQLLERRHHEANIRETYLERSFDMLILEQTSKILSYESDDRSRKRDSRQHDIGLRTLQDTLKDYEDRKQLRLEENRKLRALGVDTPKVVGVCALVAAPEIMFGDDEESAPDVEAVAVQVAMQYELDHGRDPESVELSNLGFDLRSRGQQEIRYIEVKGRRGMGAISLTANEWIKAGRFGEEYWLYVVYDCGTSNPRLLVIRDPARTLSVVENTHTAARFRVNVGDINKHGREADAVE